MFEQIDIQINNNCDLHYVSSHLRVRLSLKSFLICLFRAINASNAFLSPARINLN